MKLEKNKVDEWLYETTSKMPFGQIVDLHVEDGAVVNPQKSRLIKKWKPSESADKANEEKRQAEIRKFAEKITTLSGANKVNLKVAHGIPLDMDHEEILR